MSQLAGTFPVAHVDNRELHGDGDHGNTAVTADTPR